MTKAEIRAAQRLLSEHDAEPSSTGSRSTRARTTPGTAAPVRFLSMEPLLGPVDLSPWLFRGFNAPEWVIVGGESGPGHRPLNIEHARTIRDQCRTGCVPFLFKQVGGHRPTSGGDLLDGMQYKDFPSCAPDKARAEEEDDD